MMAVAAGCPTVSPAHISIAVITTMYSATGIFISRFTCGASQRSTISSSKTAGTLEISSAVKFSGSCRNATANKR